MYQYICLFIILKFQNHYFKTFDESLLQRLTIAKVDNACQSTTDMNNVETYDAKNHK